MHLTHSLILRTGPSLAVPATPSNIKLKGWVLQNISQTGIGFVIHTLTETSMTYCSKLLHKITKWPYPVKVKNVVFCLAISMLSDGKNFASVRLLFSVCYSNCTILCFLWFACRLPHLPLMPHIYVSKLCQHLFRKMACRRPGPKPLSEPMLNRLLIRPLRTKFC